jgi:hypothetical protein
MIVRMTTKRAAAALLLLSSSSAAALLSSSSAAAACLSPHLRIDCINTMLMSVVTCTDDSRITFAKNNKHS